MKTKIICCIVYSGISLGIALLAAIQKHSQADLEILHFISVLTGTPLKYILDNSNLIVSMCTGKFIRTKKVNFT